MCLNKRVKIYIQLTTIQSYIPTRFIIKIIIIRYLSNALYSLFMYSELHNTNTRLQILSINTFFFLTNWRLIVLFVLPIECSQNAPSIATYGDNLKFWIVILLLLFYLINNASYITLRENGLSEQGYFVLVQKFCLPCCLDSTFSGKI